MSFYDNIGRERYAPATSDALHLCDMLVSAILKDKGLPIPRGHRGKLSMISRIDLSSRSYIVNYRVFIHE